ncbi:hypothetical protein CLCR_02185 [Cladophialophora carrionii]|uniref:Uncharacterized protein n=1 Tax=Cladophialophora carrionii TaxID=86049 RepID=A0A1C1CDX8_9EURO|nr:hypothetical protein CLCR_02185 [Cladophialophora carrionii]
MSSHTKPPRDPKPGKPTGGWNAVNDNSQNRLPPAGRPTRPKPSPDQPGKPGKPHTGTEQIPRQSSCRWQETDKIAGWH